MLDNSSRITDEPSQTSKIPNIEAKLGKKSDLAIFKEQALSESINESKSRMSQKVESKK